MGAFLGVIFVIFSIIAVVFSSKKPQQLIIPQLIIISILNLFSFLLFSGIIQNKIAFTWMFAGLLIGLLFGFIVKMNHSENKILFIQNRFFSLSYLSLLLINQLIAIVFNSFIPIMIFITSLTVGMQLGQNCTIIYRGKKLTKSLINPITRIIIIMLISGFLLNHFSISSFSQNECIESAINEYNGWIASYKNWLENGGNYNLVAPEPDFTAQIEAEADAIGALYFSGELSYEESRPRTEAIWNKYYLRSWQLTLEREYKILNEKLSKCEAEYGLTIGDIPPPDVNDLNSFNFDVKINEQNSDSSSAPAPSSQIASDSDTSEQFASDSDTSEQISENPFVPQKISKDKANSATALSGFFAGLSSLINSISSLIGGLVNIEKPKIGTRNKDGKILTKNHGWQNENLPELQLKSLKQVVSTLENDIQRYTLKGDRLRAEIAKEELIRNNREIKRLNEDMKDITKTRTIENSELIQSSAKRLNKYIGQLDNAIWYTNAISYVSDITLAIGTSGISPAITSAKKTLESLSLAKEILSSATEGYVNNENLSVTITKYGINKGYSVGVGKIFDAKKIKYDIENSSNKLKAFIGVSESSTSTVLQKISDETGLTKEITDPIDSADNYFKDKANSIKNIGKGGPK